MTIFPAFVVYWAQVLSGEGEDIHQGVNLKGALKLAETLNEGGE